MTAAATVRRTVAFAAAIALSATLVTVGGDDADGDVVTPGDTKAEENAWNAAFLNLAVAMLPGHPNRAVWRDKANELMMSAYSRPSDLSNDAEINGRPVADWLNGSNIFGDGTLVNHGFIHPDCFTSIANSVGAPLVYGLAGLPTPVITVDLQTAADIDSIYVYSGYQRTDHDPTSTLKDFTVEVHTGDGSRRVAEIVDNVDHRVTVRDLDVRGDAVRLSISDPSGSTIDVARVFEIEVYESTTS